MSKKQKMFKICLSGQKGVGKTSIFNCLRGLPFKQKPIAEINVYYHSVSVNGEVVMLQVWDTAGLEEYNSLTENYYRSAKGIVEVFSFDSGESLSYTKKSVENVKSCDFAPDAHYFLVGNKTDIKESYYDVALERVHALLHDEPGKFEKFMKTSAKNNQGITELFEAVAHNLVIAHAKPMVQENLIAARYENANKNGCC